MRVKPKRIRRRKTDGSRLVKRYWENKPAREFGDALGTAGHGHGIYVLYRGRNVYYVGLSKRSIRGRLRSHFKSRRHRGKWDRFSFYQIGRVRYIKDVESLLLRIVRPPGNSVSGKFRRRYDMSRKK